MLYEGQFKFRGSVFFITHPPEKKSGDRERKKKKKTRSKEDFKVDIFDSLEDIGKNSGSETRNVIATAGFTALHLLTGVKIEKKAMETSS